MCTGLVLYSKANRRARESGPARAAGRELVRGYNFPAISMATVRGTILVQQLCGPLRALHLVEQVRAVSQVGLLLR